MTLMWVQAYRIVQCRRNVEQALVNGELRQAIADAVALGSVDRWTSWRLSDSYARADRVIGECGFRGEVPIDPAGTFICPWCGGESELA